MKNLNFYFPPKSFFISDVYIDNILKTQKWVDHGSDINYFFEDVQNGLINLQGDDKHIIREWLSLRYDYIINEINHELQENSKIYRSISKEQFDNMIIYKRTGIYWSTNKYTIPYGDVLSKDTYITLMTDIWKCDINWYETFKSRIDYKHGDEEQEICLKENSVIMIEKIYADVIEKNNIELILDKYIYVNKIK